MDLNFGLMERKHSEGGPKLRLRASLGSWLVVLILALGALTVSCGGTEEKEVRSVAPLIETTDPGSQSGVTKVTVNMAGSMGKYEYDPNEFVFKAGESVDFTLVGDPELHTFTIKTLGVDWSLAPEETKTFSFTFGTTGSYEIVCIPHPEMKGTIVVQ